MAWFSQEAVINAQPIGAVSATALVPIGTTITAEDRSSTGASLGGGEFIYLQGGTSVILGSLCTYTLVTGATVLAPATAGNGPVAASMSTLTAGQYGWFQRQGRAAVKAPNAMVVGADVFMLAATPGSVDDAAVAGEQVLCARVGTSTGTPATGLAYIDIDRPFLQGQIT